MNMSEKGNKAEKDGNRVDMRGKEDVKSGTSRKKTRDTREGNRM